MTTNAPIPSRHARLAGFLQQDPDNPVLLAEASQAALQEGLFADAERHIDAGMRLEGRTQAWRFRLANLRIAERRLDEARTLLLALQAEAAEAPPAAAQSADAATGHNLAFVSFLQSGFAACAKLLEPWVRGDKPSTPAEQDAMFALWLRAMHQQGKIEEAWQAVEAREASQIGAGAAGVASLIALDFDRMEAAARLAAHALAVSPSHPEACMAAASIAMSTQDHAGARTLLGRVTAEHPHQARGWSMLGFLGIVEGLPADAVQAFTRALALAPGDIPTQLGMGWARLLAGDAEGAARAFRSALAAEPHSADAHGALAVALAMQGQRVPAGAARDTAVRLEPANVPAALARALLEGGAENLQDIQRIAAAALMPANPAR